jgi:hypothetical protein
MKNLKAATPFQIAYLIGSLFPSFTQFGRDSFIMLKNGEVKEARNEKT